MSSSAEPNRSLTAEDRQALERLVNAFEEAWQRGDRPRLEDHLPAGGLRKAVLVELAHVDLERRLAAGEAVEVETYWQRFPELAGEAVELIVTEIEQRYGSGAAAAAGPYVQRFPEHAAALLLRLNLSAANLFATETVGAPAARPAGRG